jgi:MBG domain (YGX type)
VNGDTSSVFSGSQTRAAGQNVGSYAISQGSLSAGSNYTITYTGTNFAITPAPVIVTALGGSSTFGSSPSNPGLSATGLQNGQSVNVLTGLSNSFGITSTSAVGSYTLQVIGTLTNPNYSLTGTNNGIWTVNPGSTPPPSPPVPTLTPPVTAAFPNYWPSIQADREARVSCGEDETANCSGLWLRRPPFLLANPFDHSDAFEHWLPAAAPAVPSR